MQHSSKDPYLQRDPSLLLAGVCLYRGVHTVGPLHQFAHDPKRGGGIRSTKDECVLLSDTMHESWPCGDWEKGQRGRT